MADRKKLAELISDFLSYLPWGEVSSRTPEELADYLLKEGVRMEQATSEEGKRWIPVTERLPEEHQECLVYTKSPHAHARRVNKARYYGYSWHGTGGCWGNVTHWMPLPEPPMEEENGKG